MSYLCAHVNLCVCLHHAHFLIDRSAVMLICVLMLLKAGFYMHITTSQQSQKVYDHFIANFLASQFCPYNSIFYTCSFISRTQNLFCHVV